ncbi:MAG: hypothetical protein R2828_24360 [Saprospiraceae bacterium]
METALVTNPHIKKPIQLKLKGRDLNQMLGIMHIPYPSTLCFEPLVEYIEEKQYSEDYAEAFLAKTLLERIALTPELRGPIEDRGLLEQFKDTLQLMMLCFLPPALRDTQLVKLSAPFEMDHIYSTPAMEKLKDGKEIQFETNQSNSVFECSAITRASSLILNRFYGQNIDVDPSLTISVTDKNGLVRFYKTIMDFQFLKIKLLKPLKPLSQEQINEMLSNMYDTKLWLTHLPADHFEFTGFTIGHLVDITEEESLSRLRYHLLEKNTLVDPTKLEHIRNLLRNYFGFPKLKVGITAIDYPLENTVAHQYKIRYDFLADREKMLLAPENAGSIYEKVCKYRTILLMEDLKEIKRPTAIEKDLLAAGIRSIIVAPLMSQQDKVIGLLEIGAAQPYALHTFIELKFKEVVGLFSMAVERSREEIDNKIESIIREQYTALHPSVEWRFIEASYNLLEAREKDENATVEPIIFQDVYPLYGQADIVSSSEKRNKAIQADLLHNLQLVKEAIQKSTKLVTFPLANQLLMKVEKDLDELNHSFNSGDESRIIETLHDEIHPLLRQLGKTFEHIQPITNQYFKQIDEQHGMVYLQRKNYESSVSKLNNAISSYLLQEEKKMQKVLPHYFEKYKTDGVEYDLYLGQSLLRKDCFSDLHLKNFRLWQLINMTEVTRLVHKLGPKLPVPLETAQLIFAYTSPLSIRFRMDEKQFDVDGAYNVRYEILKKRIDKATIEETGERLTVAGKIAIVYLQDKDKQEYLEYLEYLVHEGYIEDNIESLNLGKLQGVQGLKALRVTVKGV